MVWDWVVVLVLCLELVILLDFGVLGVCCYVFGVCTLFVDLVFRVVFGFGWVVLFVVMVILVVLLVGFG